MKTENIYGILLISAILAQISWTKPLNEDGLTNTTLLKYNDLCLQETKYNLEPSELDISLSPSNELFTIANRIYQDISLKYVIVAKLISDKLLTNDEILTSQSAKILEFKQNLTEFKEKYTLCDDTEKLHELADLYTNTTVFYYELDETTLDDNDKIILGLLRKYSSKDLEEYIEEIFSEYMIQFKNKIESLKNDLEKEEGKLGKKVLEWFEHFRTLTDSDDIDEAFLNFYEMCEEELDQ